MIKYNLTCKCKCTFDSWFASSEEFERLMKRKLITCIECDSNTINKSIMSPNISNSKKFHFNQFMIDLHAFINKLNISEDLKIELKKISPYNYIGILK